MEIWNSVREDRMSLGGGMHLRLLSAGQLLEARREAGKLAKEPGERPLCSNACLVARCLWEDGAEKPLFENGQQVLDALSAGDIEALAKRWDMFRRSFFAGAEEVEWGINPNFEAQRGGVMRA